MTADTPLGWIIGQNLYCPMGFNGPIQSPLVALKDGRLWLIGERKSALRVRWLFPVPLSVRDCVGILRRLERREQSLESPELIDALRKAASI